MSLKLFQTQSKVLEKDRLPGPGKQLAGTGRMTGIALNFQLFDIYQSAARIIPRNARKAFYPKKGVG